MISLLCPFCNLEYSHLVEHIICCTQFDNEIAREKTTQYFENCNQNVESRSSNVVVVEQKVEVESQENIKCYNDGPIPYPSVLFTNLFSFNK